MNRLTRFLLSVGVVAGFAVAPASAQLTRFASFTPDATAPFQFVNSGSGSTFSGIGTVTGTFTFLVPNAYDQAAGNTTFSSVGATLTISSAVSNPASLTNATSLSQPMSQIVMQIVANTPQNGLSNLLSLTGTGSIDGTSGSSNANFEGDTAKSSTVNFTSDFLNFGNTTQRTFNFALNSAQPVLGLDINGYLRSFQSGGVADFAENPAPSTSTPESGTLALLVLPAAVCGTVVLRRKIRKA